MSEQEHDDDESVYDWEDVELSAALDARDSLATQLEDATQALAVLRAALVQVTRERDEARNALDYARATNARLHRRAQAVEVGKPDDEETIRRLRAEVRATAKHNGTLTGSIYRLRDAMIAARRDAYEARTKLARIREMATRDYHETCAWALSIIDKKEGGQ